MLPYFCVLVFSGARVPAYSVSRVTAFPLLRVPGRSRGVYSEGERIMQTITMVNRKGGVAKTTSVLNLAAEFAARDLRVLAVDTDPQGTLTLIAGERPEHLAREETTLAALLAERFDVDPHELAVEAPWGGDIWRSSPDLSGAEVELTSGDVAGPHQRLRRSLQKVGDSYDLVLIDSPPSVGKLVLNSLVAADHLLIPVSADYASAGGLSRLFQTVTMVQEYERPELQALGIFGTMMRRTLHARETLDALDKSTDGLLFRTSIPQAVAVQDAQSSHQAVSQTEPGGRAASAYRKLANEVLERLEQQSGIADLRKAGV